MDDARAPLDSTCRDLIASYVRRADVLRQIHGRKASSARRWEVVYLVVTVVVATVVTTLGFAGPQRIAAVLPEALADDRAIAIVELAFNIAVLVILILTLVGLIYRYGERANVHFRSVELLTEFIRDLSDATSLHDSGIRPLGATDLDVVRTRYKGILGALPPNTDREYLKARFHAARKRALASSASPLKTIEAEPELTLELVANEAAEGDLVHGLELARIIGADPARVAALSAVEAVFGDQGWVVGGFTREAVWDFLEGARISPPLGEVDVMYFDAADVSREAERAHQQALAGQLRNVEWSVKNQARMHLANGHEPYTGVSDSLSHAPETASAVGIQLRGRTLHVLAPIGLRDLFGLVLRRNSTSDAQAFEKRTARTYQSERWPHLRLESSGGEP